MTTPAWLQNAFIHVVDVYGRVDAGVDEYGNPMYATTQIATVMGLLQPFSQADIQLGRAGVGAYQLFLPAELRGQLDQFCTFVVEGQSYEADGGPNEFTALFAPGVHHIEVAVIRSSA